MADIDKEHDMTDADTFRKKIKQEDEASKAPCGKCIQSRTCTQPFYCQEYKQWRKQYMEKRRS